MARAEYRAGEAGQQGGRTLKGRIWGVNGVWASEAACQTGRCDSRSFPVQRSPPGGGSFNTPLFRGLVGHGHHAPTGGTSDQPTSHRDRSFICQRILPYERRFAAGTAQRRFGRHHHPANLDHLSRRERGIGEAHLAPFLGLGPSRAHLSEWETTRGRSSGSQFVRNCRQHVS